MVELQVCVSSIRDKEKMYKNAGLVMFPMKLVVNLPSFLTKEKSETDWLV